MKSFMLMLLLSSATLYCEEKLATQTIDLAEAKSKSKKYQTLRDLGVLSICAGTLFVGGGTALVIASGGQTSYNYTYSGGKSYESGSLPGAIGFDLAVLGVVPFISGGIVLAIIFGNKKKYWDKVIQNNGVISFAVSPWGAALAYRF